MAKLFDDIFSDGGTGDLELTITDPDESRGDQVIRLHCHTLILTQQSYFFNMLNANMHLREGRKREVLIAESCDDFVELIRFMYTGQIEINRVNVPGLLILADKYCVDEVVDLCLKHIKDNFDADMFFNFYSCMTLNSAYQEKLRTNL